MSPVCHLCVACVSPACQLLTTTKDYNHLFSGCGSESRQLLQTLSHSFNFVRECRYSALSRLSNTILFFFMFSQNDRTNFVGQFLDKETYQTESVCPAADQCCVSTAHLCSVRCICVCFVIESIRLSKRTSAFPAYLCAVRLSHISDMKSIREGHRLLGECVQPPTHEPLTGKGLR